VKLSDAVARFLAQHVDRVFVVNGGACLHLIHSIAECPGIDFTCPHHEQAAGFAADAYARLRGLGVAMATSGPGATNLITPIAASYYDSIPVLCITGQVTTGSMTGSLGVRQVGFQETPIVEMVRPVTKFAETLMQPERALVMLRAAVAVALEGRPGPVLVDIPDDLQRVEI
jgi:acetolactate synthase I/II/III large subunit